MTMKVTRRCHECGTGQVVPLAKAGRKERYKALMLEIPAHVEIPTCNNCGSEWMDPATARAIDQALKSVTNLGEILGSASSRAKRRLKARPSNWLKRIATQDRSRFSKKEMLR